MLDRLQVADLKDEIVGMQIDLNQILYETHSEIVGKTEMQQQQHQNLQTASTTSIQQYQPIHQSVPIQPTNTQSLGKAQQTHLNQQPPVQYQLHQQPSQIIKAKQEMKLMESFKSEQIKVEIPGAEKKSFSNVQHNQPPMLIQMPALCSPKNSCRSEKPLKSPVKAITSKVVNQKVLHHTPLTQQKDLKKELENFDIESEITPSFIMKKCETYNYHNINNNQQLQTNPPAMSSSTRTDKVSHKKSSSNKVDEFPMDYFGDNSNKDKIDGKMEPYDEWLSIQTELNMQLTNVKEINIKHDRKQHPSLSTSVVKSVENDLNDIFEQHSSPKSVEKQLDDLFNNPSKSIIGTASPLAELFNAPTIVVEKSVENRLEALFESDDEESMAEKANVDLVETRLEQLFQGSGSANDESALDNHSFLYKSSEELTYDMIQQQMHQNATSGISITASTSGDVQQSNKRQWNNPGCDMMYGNQLSSPPQPTKRPCISTPQYDTSKWMIDDTFGFGSLGTCDNAEILHETSGDEASKRHWNGDIMDLEHGPSKKNCYNPDDVASKMNHCNALQSDNHSILQHHTSMSDSVIVQHSHQHQHFDEMHHFEHLHHQSPNDAVNSTASAGTSLPINFEDDINRQVQNAIDSILNLQGSEPDSLQFSLDQTMGTFLESSMISSTSVINSTTPAAHQLPQQQQQGFSQNFQQRQTIISKRKYTTRLDDIGDCLIGGSSNLDDSPSSSLSLAHIDGSTGNDFGGAGNLMDEAVKSIITS